jgi:hypothetical protein
LLLTLVPASAVLAAVHLQDILLPPSLDLAIGSTSTLNVIYLPEDTTDSRTVVWTSSAPSVATVTDGVVSAVSLGTATITAAVGGKTSDCLVTVRPKNSGGGSIEIKNAFTDANFLAAVREVLDYPDPGGSIYDREAEGIRYLDVSGRDIVSLDGIEHFTALEYLYCDDNQLTALDVSNNTALEHLSCNGNQLTSLDVSHNPSLEYLWINFNNLPSRSAITGLSGTSVNTDESATDMNGRPYFLYTPQGKDITSDFTDADFLAAVRDEINKPSGVIYDMDVEGITRLDVSGRDIASLDGIEHFTALEYLYCYDNLLTTLDVSNNTALVYLDSRENQLTALNVSNNPSLRTLHCENNQLISLDVSNNPALEDLWCRYNKLTALNVSTNTALTDLYCGNNQLATLDVSKNPALETLDCRENKLMALDVSDNPLLEYFNCGYNQLTELDVSDNPALKSFGCYNNQLTALDVSKNLALQSLTCGDNQLTTLSVSNNAALETFDCRENKLTALDVTHNPLLELLQCFNNNLTVLETHNPLLELLNCSHNKLTSLNVSNNSALKYLYIDHNNLPSKSAITGLSNTSVNADENATDAGGANYFTYTPQNTGGSTPGGSFTLTQAGITYGQTLADPRVAGNAGAITFSYTGTLRDGVTAYGPTAAKPSEAGAYKVTATAASAAAASADFTIAPKALTLTGLSVVTKTYDRSAAAALTGTPVLAGVIGSDGVSADLSAVTAVFDSAAAGVSKPVTVTGLALAGPKAFNYTLPATLSLRGEIKARIAGDDAPLVTPNLSGPEQVKLTDNPPIYNTDPATDAELWDMVYKLREDTAFRSVTPESPSVLFMDLALVLTTDGTTPYNLKSGESLNVVFPYPSAAIAQNYKNYRFVLLHYTSGGETETITTKAESYGIEATLTELSPYALAWTQISSGSRGGGGGGAVPVEPVVPGTPGVTVSKATLSHISGINRVETSVAISRQGWTSAETVILAPGGQNNLIDALAVAPLAGQERAPILLSTGSLDPAVVAEIQRLGAKKIYAVGAISQDVINALQAALPGVTVENLKGANRFETANLINAKLTAPQGTFVVGYNAVADAVSAASFAAANGYAIQIASPDGSISAAPTGTAYILGGPTLVSDVAGATRLYGATRYETNKAIRDALTFEYTNIYTADGNTLVDALTGSALAAQTKAAIVLTPGNDPTGVDFGKITTETKVYAFGAAK